MGKKKNIIIIVVAIVLILLGLCFGIVKSSNSSLDKNKIQKIKEIDNRAKALSILESNLGDDVSKLKFVKNEGNFYYYKLNDEITYIVDINTETYKLKYIIKRGQVPEDN